MKHLRYFLTLFLCITTLLPVTMWAQRASTSYVSNSAMEKLVAYWPLDETSGDRAPGYTGMGNTVQTLTDNNSTSFDIGKLRNSALFSKASSQYLSVIDTAQTSMGDIDMSITAWFTLASAATGSGYTIISKWTLGGSREYQLFVDGDQKVKFWVMNTANTTVTECNANTKGALSSGVYYFVYASHDSVNDRLSISVDNGTVDQVTSYTGGIRDSTNPFQIGAHTNPSEFFDGAIDMVCLWKKVLSADEISFMYRSGAGRAPMGFNYKLDLFEDFFDPWKKSYKLFAGNRGFGDSQEKS